MIMKLRKEYHWLVLYLLLSGLSTAQQFNQIYKIQVCAKSSYLYMPIVDAEIFCYDDDDGGTNAALGSGHTSLTGCVTIDYSNAL